MFDRIEMNVIHVPAKILVVADGVFPETWLPDSTAYDTRRNQRLGEVSLDQTHTLRIIGVPFRKRTKQMQMVRHDHNSIDGESTRSSHLSKRLSQDFYVIYQVTRSTIPQRQRQRVSTTGHPISPILDHRDIT